MLPAILGALPLLMKVPAAVKEISALFGFDKGEKAADVADKVARALSTGQVSAEQVDGMNEIYLRNKERIAEIALEEKQDENRFHTRNAELTAQNIQTEAKSEDEYVRRTRPWAIRQTFHLMATLAVLLPVCLTVLITLKADATLIKGLMEMGNELFKYVAGVFTAGFLGYTYVRSAKDKTTAAGHPPKGLLESVAGLMRGGK